MTLPVNASNELARTDTAFYCQPWYAPKIKFRRDEVADHLATFGIDAGRRFIEHEDSWSTEQRERQQRSLLFSTTEASPRSSCASFQVQEFEEFVGPPRRVVVRSREFEHLARRHREPDTASLQQGAGPYDDFSMVAYGIEAVESHRAGRRCSKPEQRFDDGGLSRTVGPEQRDDLAVGDVK